MSDERGAGRGDRLDRSGEESHQRAGALAGALPAAVPPAGLEERVVATLRARGLLAQAGSGVRASGRSPRLRYAALAAAALLVFAAGAAVGAVANANRQAPPLPVPRFALLLYETAATSASGAEEARLVEEYSRWARDLAMGGRYVSGEKLGSAMRLVRATAPDDAAAAAAADGRQLGGLFIVQAATMDEAEAIARSCPHARHGGVIVVRPIDPT